MRSNQKGFSVVAILVVIVIIGLIGTVGWLVYDRQNGKTDNQQTNTPASEQKQEATTPRAQKYLEIKEEGIKIKLSEPILDAYSVASDGGVAFGLSSLDTIPACKVHDLTTGAGPNAVGVASLSFDKYAEGFRTDQKPEDSAFKNNQYATRVGDNWYEIEAANANECRSTDATVQAKIQAAKDAFREASKTITKL